MLIQWAHYAFLSLAFVTVEDNSRVLSTYELNAFHHNSTYRSDFPMSNEDDG